MATQDDVRRIALSFPGAREGKDHFAFSVPVKGKDRGFAWVWLERVHPKKARVPQPEVLAVRVADLSQKDMLIASDPDTYFTEPHYNGYPAVLVRLAAIGVDELEALLLGAWRCQAPKALHAELEAAPPPAAKVKRAPRRKPKPKPKPKPGARGSGPRRTR
jgi:hypothetical protein